MKMTNEQIEKMLRGLASFNTHYDNMKKEAFHLDGASDDATIHALPDLREILSLRQRVQELETQVRSIALSRNELAATVERLKAQQSEVAAEHIEYACRQYSIGVDVAGQGMFDMVPLTQLLDYANQLREQSK